MKKKERNSLRKQCAWLACSIQFALLFQFSFSIQKKRKEIGKTNILKKTKEEDLAKINKEQFSFFSFLVIFQYKHLRNSEEETKIERKKMMMMIKKKKKEVNLNKQIKWKKQRKFLKVKIRKVTFRKRNKCAFLD